MIAVGINGRRAQVVAGNTQMVLPCFNIRSQLAQLGFQRSNPIRFLDPKVANVEKKLPRSFISKDGYSITSKARQYLAPLIKGEDYPPYKNGLPGYVQIKGQLVAKKLPAFEPS